MSIKSHFVSLIEILWVLLTDFIVVIAIAFSFDKMKKIIDGALDLGDNAIFDQVYTISKYGILLIFIIYMLFDIVELFIKKLKNIKKIWDQDES